MHFFVYFDFFYCLTQLSFCLFMLQIRRAHFEGFNAFLDRLVHEGHLTQDQVGVLLD